MAEKLLDTLARDEYYYFVELLQPAMAQAKRTGCGKQVLSIEKKMHKFDSFGNGNVSNSAAIGRHGQSVQFPTMPQSFASNFNSAATTMPPLSAAATPSQQRSRLPHANGDTVEGAAASRKGSEPSSMHSADR